MLRLLLLVPCSLENWQEVALAQSLFKKREDPANPLFIERRSSLLNHSPDILDVFRASSKHLRDDEVLRADDGNLGLADCDRNRPLQKIFLETRPGQDNIQRHARAAIDKGQNARAGQEIGIVNEEMETALPHRLDERVDDFGIDCRGDIDIRAETWASPDDRGLCTEQVPRQTPLGHHGRQGTEKLSDRAAT